MNRRPLSRRIFLRGLGVTLALPFLDSLDPLRAFTPRWSVRDAFGADVTMRKKFIACFFPNGVYAPSDWNIPAIDGDWTWGDFGDDHVATKPGLLRELYEAHRANFMVVRGVNTFGPDTHLYSLASFLSAHRIYKPDLISQPKLLTAPPSLDQRILKQLGRTGAAASLQIGLPYNPKTDADVDPYAAPNQDYANAISYGFSQNPLLPEFLPQNVFKKAFGNGVPAQAAPGQPSIVDYYHSRGKSILDVVLADRNAALAKAGKEDALRIASIFDNIREIETRLFGTVDSAPPAAATCTIPDQPNYKWDEGFFTRGFESVEAFKEPFRLMQKIVVQALECDITSVATIMYMPSWGAGDRFNMRDIPYNCHWCSHHHQQNDLRDAHRQYGKMFVDLYQDLLTEIKSRPGLIDQTIAILGSDHGDGNNHGNRNGPFLVAGQGADLALNPNGSIVGDANTIRYRPDVMRELGRLFGVPYQSYGEFDDDPGLNGSLFGAPAVDPAKNFRAMGIIRS